MHDIYMLNMHPQLVVLSACETGVGKLQKGEGVISIARGFQYSGANNLLFSLWKVNDLSTSQLMTSFYKNYKKTNSAYLSNYRAKLEYLNNTNIDNIKKSPYYWGSFVFYGTIEPESSNYSFYLLGLLLTLIILFLLLKIKNAKS
jgi:CHAT domain-containing protein